MNVSRRDFLKYCGAAAATMGLSGADLFNLREALANPLGPKVIWIVGAACSGCSVSLLNRISTTAPTNVADLLINSIDLVYHPTIMAASGDTAVGALMDAYNAGGYVLVVEGGIPTAFGGAMCLPYSIDGQPVTFLQMVRDFSAKAAAVVCIGQCSAYGGVPAAKPNPARMMGVRAVTGVTTINIAGCPPHPDWICWAIVQLLTGAAVPLDSSGRPKALYSQKIHEVCPRREIDDVETYGIDNACLEELGCRGPNTYSSCVSSRWNNAQNWCIDANSPCIGCTQPTFPGTSSFYK